MKLNIGTKIMAGFAFARLMLVVIGIVTYVYSTKMKQTTERVAHNYKVIQAIDIELSNLKDAETGQRGYVITGIESYLEPFTNAEKS